MEQPPGFVHENNSNLVCKLEKSLYGLKQAPRVWYSELKSFLLSVGFHQSKSDSCLFIYHQMGKLIYLLVYVDDIIITGADSSSVEEFIHALSRRFSIKDLGALHFFLGVEVTRTPTGLFLSQQNYIRELLEKVHMHEAKSAPTPMTQKTVLSLNDSRCLSDVQEYRALIGSLQYLLLTRPDVAYVVNKLSQYTSKPTENHWSSLKRLLRYLVGTFDFGLSLHKETSVDLHAFSDADWAGNQDDRKSTGAYVIFLGKNPIAWSSKKQKTVARSSTEAEYKSVASTAADLVWVRNLLEELQVTCQKPPVIYCDNLGATYVAANPVFHSRMKHVEIDYHFVREQVQNGSLRVCHVSTKEQLADLLTKPLSVSDFCKLRSKIGVTNRSPSCGGVLDKDVEITT